MVPYDIGLKVVESIDNSHIHAIKLNDRKHNPNYTRDAIAYMNEVFGKYNQLIKDKKIKNDNDRIEYFKDVSLPKLVEQDQEIIKSIIDFIK